MKTSLLLFIPVLLFASCSAPDNNKKAADEEQKDPRKIEATVATAIYLNRGDSVEYLNTDTTMILIVHRDSSGWTVSPPPHLKEQQPHLQPVKLPAYVCRFRNVQEMVFMMPLNEIPAEISCLKKLGSIKLNLYGEENPVTLAASINAQKQIRIVRVWSAKPRNGQVEKLKKALDKDVLLLQE